MTDQIRRQLPIVGVAKVSHGRDRMTCLYRCGNACDHAVPNGSDNQYFGDLVKNEVTRRGVLRTGAVGAVALGLGSAGVLSASPAFAATEPAPALPLVEEFGTADGADHRTHLQGGRAQPGRRAGRAQRLRPLGGHPLGRPGGAGRAEVRRPQPEPGRAAQAVRLQQRLRRRAAARQEGQPRAARVQPRVHQRRPDVPELREPGRADGRAGQDRDGRARHVGRRDRAGRQDRPVRAGDQRGPARTTGA